MKTHEPSAVTDNTPSSLSWDFAIPLLTNRRIWTSLLRLLLIVMGLFSLLVGLPLAAEKEWEALGIIIGGMSAIAVGLFVFGMLLLAAITGNRFHMRFTLNAEGTVGEVTDTRAKVISRASFIGGMTVGSMGAAGSGLATIGREHILVPWEGIKRAVYHPFHRTIDLRSGWRTMLTIYCSADNYESTAAFVREHLAKEEKRRPNRHFQSLGPLLGWSTAVVVACAPLFFLPYPYEIERGLPILLLVPALASVWFLPFLGWVTLAAVCFFTLHILTIGFAAPAADVLTGYTISYIFSDIIGGELHLTLALLGLAFLTWYAVRTARGRGPSAITREGDYGHLAGRRQNEEDAAEE